MKLVIAGCRTYSPSWGELDSLILGPIDVATTEIVHGGCPSGVDSAVHEWATNRCLKLKVFPADWGKHGKAAGPIRNKEMAQYGDRLIAFWDGESRGTLSMITEMAKARKHITVAPIGEQK